MGESVVQDLLIPFLASAPDTTISFFVANVDQAVLDAYPTQFGPSRTYPVYATVVPPATNVSRSVLDCLQSVKPTAAESELVYISDQSARGEELRASFSASFPSSSAVNQVSDLASLTSVLSTLQTGTPADLAARFVVFGPLTALMDNNTDWSVYDAIKTGNVLGELALDATLYDEERGRSAFMASLAVRAPPLSVVLSSHCFSKA